MKFDVITCGSATVDAFVDTNVHEEHRSICYNIGDKILIRDLTFSTGGGGTNTAASFSKLGLKTGYIGKLGGDNNAALILKELKKLGVSFLGVNGKENTGYSIILDSLEHERTVLAYKGVNDHLKYSELKLKNIESKWLYCSSMLHESFETQRKIIREMRKKGTKIAYNASLYQAKEGKEHFKGILNITEVLVLNKEEAEALVGIEGNLFKHLRKLGVKIVCVTDGKNGNIVYDGETLYEAEAHKNIKAVERTGAGDAFASGFVAGLIKRNSIEDAIQLGSLNAEGVIQIKGAKNGLLSWNEFLKRLKKDPVKISKKLL